MKLPPELLAKYPPPDADTEKFYERWDEEHTLRVLCVGSREERIADALSEAGQIVTGVDLREAETGVKYSHTRADFCGGGLDGWHGCFDAAVCISAVEHFGLGTYGEGRPHPYYDVLAMREIWHCLKPGGVCYLSVPYGGRFFANSPHWRVYDAKAAMERLVQDFRCEHAAVFVADDAPLGGLGGTVLKRGDPISWSEANAYSGHPPHVSLFLKLRKVPASRLAPDGR